MLIKSPDNWHRIFIFRILETNYMLTNYVGDSKFYNLNIFCYCEERTNSYHVIFIVETESW